MDAKRTHMHAHMAAVRTHYFDGLQIRFRHLFRSVVGMAHQVAAEPSFSANLTGTCHGLFLQIHEIGCGPHRIG